jgi:ZIP family zinc transporter
MWLSRMKSIDPVALPFQMGRYNRSFCITAWRRALTMNQVYVAILLLSCLSFITTLTGVFLAVRFRESKKGIAVGIGFSAGIMLVISFAELLPEAAAETGAPTAILAAVVGGLVLFSLHLVIPHTHLVEEKEGLGSQALKSAYLVVFGLILHDFPEGFAMANSYIASPSLGILIAVAIAIHNLPEEFAMAVPAAMLKRERFLYGSALVSALAEPAGAIIGLVSVNLMPALNPLFMAFAAGAMIFVSVHELVPMAKQYGNQHLFATGLALSVVVYLILSAII